MPSLAPEKRGAGLQLPRVDDRLPLRRPDQTRYGPKPQHQPGETGIAHTSEGDGIVTTCRVCGWLRWHETDQDADRIAGEHKCRAKDRCLICGPPYRLEDLDCPHLMTEAKQKAAEKAARLEEETAGV